jgi:hypothetical protein
MQLGSALLVSISAMLYAHPDSVTRFNKNNNRFMMPPFSWWFNSLITG